MLLDVSLEEVFARLGKPQQIGDETVVPGRSTTAPHSPYQPDYDWLFLFERKLARLLDPWLQPRRLELIGAGGLLSEALSNAFCHAHRRDRDLPIRAQIFLCEAGLVVRVKDTGPGFAVRDVVAKYRSGAAYFHVAGNGLRKMIESDTFGVFFTDRGTAFHLLHLFHASLHDWSGASTGAPTDSVLL